MRILTQPTLGRLAKPSALRHAARRDQAAKHVRTDKQSSVNKRDRDAKPEFDPREADRWVDMHGRFTIPHTKGTRK